MPIIYSYPLVTPASDDLILGVQVLDDEQNKTVTFSVQGLIDSVEGALNTTYDFSSALDGSNVDLLLSGSDETVDTVKLIAGTNITLVRNPDGSVGIRSTSATSVSNIQTGDSTFITGSGGPITTQGTLTYSLSAIGTPSVDTFLRGDNRWATIPTNDISINPGTGIDVTSNGDVFQISNTGVTRIIAGENISISPESGTGNVTITSTATASEGTEYGAAEGLFLYPTSATQPIPRFAIETIGSNNYINAFKQNADPVPADFFSFNQLSSGSVRTVPFEDITVDMLTSVKEYLENTYITDGEGFVKNTADNFDSIDKVIQVVTLTDAEYTALADKDPNTLYLTVSTAPTQYTITMTPLTNNIVGPTEGYTIGGDLEGATRTGSEGAAYQFTTTATPNAGYQFTTAFSATNPSGTIPANNTTEVEQILTGTIEEIPNAVTVTLSVTSNVSGGTEGVVWEVTGDQDGATQSGDAPFDYSFTTGVNILDDTYEWATGPTISPTQPNAGTTNIDLTVNTTIGGTLAKKQGEATLNIIDQITGGDEGTAYSITTNNSLTQTGNVGDTVSWTTTAAAISPFAFTSGPTYAPSQTVTATLTETPQTVDQTITGAVESTQEWTTSFSIVTSDITSLETNSDASVSYGVDFEFNVTNGDDQFTVLEFDGKDGKLIDKVSTQTNLTGGDWEFTFDYRFFNDDLYWITGPTYQYDGQSNPFTGTQINNNSTNRINVTGNIGNAADDASRPFIVIAPSQDTQLPGSTARIACEEGNAEIVTGAYLSGNGTNNSDGACVNFTTGDKLYANATLRTMFAGSLVPTEYLTPSNDDISGWWKVYTSRPADPQLSDPVFGAVRLQVEFDQNDNPLYVEIVEIDTQSSAGGGCCFRDENGSIDCYKD